MGLESEARLFSGSLQRGLSELWAVKRRSAGLSSPRKAESQACL